MARTDTAPAVQRFHRNGRRLALLATTGAGAPHAPGFRLLETWGRPGLVAISLTLLLAACEGPGDAPGAPPLTEADVEANNRGVALMGYFDYRRARDVFAALAEERPGWLDARINLAIATLNRQEEGDELAALELLDGVLAEDPGNLRARYMTGLLRLYLGETDAALEAFLAVAQADPGDAFAAYYVAQALLQKERLDEAVDWYRRAIDLDPYLRSGYYGLALVLRRLGRTDDARAMLASYERFADNPRAHLAEFKYTRMGPKGEALAVGRADARPPRRPEGALFLPPRRLDEVELALSSPSLTTVDLDGDQRQDLFLTGVMSPAGPASVLYRNAGDGQLRREPGHPLVAATKVRAALWGDVDNDGLLDAYLCREGRNQLWRQTGPGQWADITAQSGAHDGEAHCVDAGLFDADHDGDLDVFVVNEDAPNELLSNNLDGTFRALAADRGLGGEHGPARGLVSADLDRDRDVDLVVINADPPHEVYLNDRLWQYRPAPGFEAFQASDIAAAVAGDADADGGVELYTASRTGDLARWRAPAAGGSWAAEPLGQASAASGPTAQLALQDFDGDGLLELMAAGAGGVEVHSLSAAGGAEVVSVGADEIQAALPVLLETAEGPSLAGVSNGQLSLWAPGPGRFAFAAFAFTGKEERAESMRSNASGIGTRLALRTGSQWSVFDTLDKHSGPGQSLQPVALGLGGRARADYIAIDWSDGVFQTELDLESGVTHRIAETQRQLASCPVLFVWDGERFAFVSDLLGVGGLGFFVEPGVYGSPRPWEYFALPRGLLEPKDGLYQLKLTEPMEENAYLDMVRLHAHDLPPGWSLILDERFAINDPAPTGQALFYRRERVANLAHNDRGQDVTELVAHADSRAAPPGALDHRFVGRLAGHYVLTLEFDSPIDLGEGVPVLAVDGWIEYPYSQTVFAAWQAGANYSAPSLEAYAGGEWHTVIREFGYPAGMPREMALPLERLPRGTTGLRLSTNMEVYWDRVRIVYAETSPEGVRSETLAPSRVRLAQTGFPLRTNAAQRRPDYDYARRSAFWDTKYMAGYYTAFGPVTALTEATDDALLIIGPGEEAHMDFPALAAPAPPGWSRVFVLEARGYAKDMDLYTEHGETVGPLPVQYDDPRAAARRDALHRRYHVRYLAGR